MISSLIVKPMSSNSLTKSERSMIAGKIISLKFHTNMNEIINVTKIWALCVKRKKKLIRNCIFIFSIPYVSSIIQALKFSKISKKKRKRC